MDSEVARAIDREIEHLLKGTRISDQLLEKSGLIASAFMAGVDFGRASRLKRKAKRGKRANGLRGI